MCSYGLLIKFFLFVAILGSSGSSFTLVQSKSYREDLKNFFVVRSEGDLLCRREMFLIG